VQFVRRVANWESPKFTSLKAATVLRTAHFACPTRVLGYPGHDGAVLTLDIIDPELSTTIMK
jgi:hypothetical protein